MDGVLSGGQLSKIWNGKAAVQELERGIQMTMTSPG